MNLRIMIGFLILAFSFDGFFGSANAEKSERKDLLPYVEAGPGGIHTQPWFLNTFLDLREDAEEACGVVG